MNEPVETPRRRLTGAVVPALAAAGLAAFATMLLVGRNSADEVAGAPVIEDCILEHADAVGGPIELVDANGATVTQADFAGSPTVVYFGFANCPDICPTSMYTLAEALSAAGGYDVQPVLVSLDPERDTPEVMGQYVRTDGFPAGLVGLTGSRAQIDAAIAAFRVYATRADIAGAPGEYNVDHSSMLYILDGNWRTVAIVQTVKRENQMDPRSPIVPAAPETIAACIAAGLERAGA